MVNILPCIKPGLTVIIGIAIIILAIRYIRLRRIWLERTLAKGKCKSILTVLSFVAGIPIFIWFLLIFNDANANEYISGAAADQDSKELFWAIIYHYIDPGNQHMANEGSPRWIAFLIAILGTVLMNGILVSVFVGFFERTVAAWENGLSRYHKILKKSRYVVIIGNHESTPSIIKQIFERKKTSVDYVVVLTNQKVDALRKKLVSYLPKRAEERTIIYSGDPTSAEDLKDLHLDYAQELFIIGDSIEEIQIEASHDALNINCLQLIADGLRQSTHQRSDKLLCHVMFEYQTTFSIFQFADITTNIKDIIDFRPFNYYELWAQKIFVNEKLSFDAADLSGYLPLEGDKPITLDSDDFVHLIVVGMSRMGVALAIEAAHLAHYPNFTCCPKLKTHITFIDKNCAEEMNYFKGRFKELFELSMWRFADSNNAADLYADSLQESKWENADINTRKSYLGEDVVDVKWEFIQGGIETPQIQQYIKQAANNSNSRVTLALCHPQDNQCVAAALYLPDEIYEKAVKVLVYQRHNASVINSISTQNKMNLYYQKLKPFGMLDEAYDDNRIRQSWDIAKILDDKYYTMYQRVTDEAAKLNETSRPSNDQPERPKLKKTRGKSEAAKQWSNIYHANTIWSKLRSINYISGKIDESHINPLARTEHNRWVTEQLLMRFRALTEAEQQEVRKNPFKKDELKANCMAHIDICSFDKLAEIDPIVQGYDAGFIEIIPDIITSQPDPQ